MENVEVKTVGKRLTKKQMWIFAIGQFGWSLLGGIISAWLVTYYLPTADDINKNGAMQYIHPGLVIGGFLTIIGLITFICRIFDAVTDPLVANLSDNSKNPKGRRFPFMKIAAIPFAVMTVVVFCAPFGAYDAGGNAGNIAWILISLILFYLFMTMYCTPYNALISEFGKTQDDRMYISTAISLTFFAGTMIAYLPFVLAGPLRGMGLSFAWSYRIPFIVLAVIGLVAMLIPTFLLNEKEFVDAEPNKTNMFKSLASTFKNREFRKFVGSDIMYFIGLTMFQTGLPFFVKVSMHLGEGLVMVFMGAMTVLSACFYPLVSGLVKKYGKKKLVCLGFLGLAVSYIVTAICSFVLNGQAEASALSYVFGIAVVVIAAFPMALLGVIPQSIVADIAEAEAITTGENRQGMFFAARTFAMKFGQSAAMLLFTSLAILGTTKAATGNDIVPTEMGLGIVAIVAMAFCILGAVILFFYNEKQVMNTISLNEMKYEGLKEEKTEEKEDK